MNKQTKEKMHVALFLFFVVLVSVLIGLCGYYFKNKTKAEEDKRYDQIVTEALKQSNVGLDEAIDKAITAAQKLHDDCMSLQKDTLTWHRVDITHNRTGEKGSIIIQMALYKSVTVTGEVFTVYLDAKPFDKEKREKAAAQKEEEEANNKATAREIKHLTREIDKEMHRRYHPSTN